MKAFYESGLYHYYYPLLNRYARRKGLAMPVAHEVALQVVWDEYCAHGTATIKGLRHLLKKAVADNCICQQQLNIFNRPAVSLPLKPGNNALPHQPLNELFL